MEEEHSGYTLNERVSILENQNEVTEKVSVACRLSHNQQNDTVRQGLTEVTLDIREFKTMFKAFLEGQKEDKEELKKDKERLDAVEADVKNAKAVSGFIIAVGIPIFTGLVWLIHTFWPSIMHLPPIK